MMKALRAMFGSPDDSGKSTRPGRYVVPKRDKNLPDEQHGRTIGELKSAGESKAPYKREWNRDAVAGKKYDGMDIDKTRIREIKGGDPDDPRWKEHNERVKKFTNKKGK